MRSEKPDNPSVCVVLECAPCVSLRLLCHCRHDADEIKAEDDEFVREPHNVVLADGERVADRHSREVGRIALRQTEEPFRLHNVRSLLRLLHRVRAVVRSSLPRQRAVYQQREFLTRIALLLDNLMRLILAEAEARLSDYLRQVVACQTVEER